MADDEKQTEKVTPVVEHKVPERKSATKPIIAPDGHVTLSKEDIDART
jgi:hypothetical protein